MHASSYQSINQSINQAISPSIYTSSPSSLSSSSTIEDSRLITTEAPSPSPSLSSSAGGSSSSSIRSGTIVSAMIVLSSSSSLSSASLSPLLTPLTGGIGAEEDVAEGAIDTLLLALLLEDEPATDILSWFCCWLSRLLTILPRLTWILYRAFRLVASESRLSSTAAETSSYRERILSSDEAGEM